MAFLPDLPNPSEGNQIMRAGAGTAYQKRIYELPQLNVNSEVTFAGGPNSRPRLVLDLNGTITLYGILAIGLVGVTLNDVLFSVPREILTPQRVTLSGNALATYATVFLRDNTGVTTHKSVLIQPPTAAKAVCDVVWTNSVETSPNEIILDGLVIRPEALL